MKKLLIVGCTLLTAFAAVAMPSKKELKEAKALVAEVTADDLKAVKNGTLTLKDFADKHMKLAKETESQAEKFYLYQGAYRIYAQAGEYELAADALEALRGEVEDVPPETIVKIIKKEMKSSTSKKAPRVMAIYRQSEQAVKCRKELVSIQDALKAKPNDAALNKKLGECLAELGRWDEALAAFAKTSGDLAKTAAGEKDGSLDLRACADFWWEYESEEDAYRTHAAALYQKAMDNGKLTGLVQEKAKKRIAEVQDAGVDVKDVVTTESKKAAGKASGRYCVIDLSGGANAKSYPVTYLDKEPKGGFNKPEYKTTKLVLKRVEAGSFIMGEDLKDKSHRVTLTKPFYMGLFETTQKQWELVMGANPSAFKGDANPVNQVSYTMVRGNDQGAKWPASNAVDAASFLGQLRSKTKIDFDLPTEAQWEYTCRAGTRTAYGYGDNADDGYMWFDKNAEGKTHTVGSKKPNKWGFYDMHGNVWEWCLDWYGPLTYGTDPKGSPKGPARVDRGGSLVHGESDSKSFWRNYCPSQAYYGEGGFRLCGPAK